MPNQRLIDFPQKTTPTSIDVLYLGDMSDSGRESQSTIDEVAAADTVNLKVANNLSDVDDVTTSRTNIDAQQHSDALDSIAGLVTDTDEMIYTAAADTYATTSLTEFARTVLDDTDDTSVRTTINAQKTMVAQKYNYGGGSASVTIPYTGITSDWVVWGNLESSTASGAVSVKQVVPGTDQIGFVFTADPEISVISWFGIEGQQG